MKKLIAAGVATALAAGALAIPAFAATKTVQVKDNKFVASSITVSKNTTVKWVWKGKAPHNVVVTKGPATFKSKTQVKGSFAKKLTKATARLVCSKTTSKASGRGKVKVKLTGKVKRTSKVEVTYTQGKYKGKTVVPLGKAIKVTAKR